MDVDKFVVNFTCQEGASNVNHYFNQFQPQRLFHNDKIVISRMSLPYVCVVVTLIENAKSNTAAIDVYFSFFIH